MKKIFNIYSTSQGIPFVNLSKSITFPSDESLEIYSTLYNDQDIPWTILSYILYGTIDYWWVLSSLNKNYPFYAPKGETIKIIVPSQMNNIIKYIR